MRRIRVLGSTLGLFALATGCATTAAGPRSAASPSGLQITRMSRAQQVAWRDSVYAQAIADVEGPGATIRAEFSNLTGSRRVRAVFNLESDAYVVVGHIDADGVLRIAFPLDPTTDEGLVRANRQYRTHEFFAGFTDQYRYRAQNGLRLGAMRNTDSYDGGLGYLFIIASWRPMRFDRFSTEGAWDSFELADDSYLRDPRPAIYELASLLVGENREAYTVRFARYNNTRSMYGDGYYASAFNSFRYCSGYRPLGFGYSPIDIGYGYGFGDFGYGMFGTSHGSSFSRRGTNYYYDSFGDCYRTGYPGGGGFGNTRYAGPTGGQRELPKRPFDPEVMRTPITPRVVGQHSMPTGRAADTPTRDVPAVSSSYRMRGLITADEPTAGRREPRVERGAVSGRSRPAIQEMVSRAPTNEQRPTTGRVSNGYGNNGNNNNASRPRPADRSTYDSPTYRDRAPSSSSGGGFMQGYSTPTDVSRSPGSSSTGGASSAPAPSAPPSGAGSGPPGSSTGSRPPTP